MMAGCRGGPVSGKSKCATKFFLLRGVNTQLPSERKNCVTDTSLGTGSGSLVQPRGVNEMTKRNNMKPKPLTPPILRKIEYALRKIARAGKPTTK